MKRIAIVGTTGVGKSTLGEQLSALLGYPFVDFDVLFQGPNWTTPPPDEMLARVSAALVGDHWITAGNYSIVRPIVWGQADTVVWLDYPLSIIYPRLFRRTVRRVMTREQLWGGNRETFRQQFMSRESIFLFAAQTHKGRIAKFTADLARPEYDHLRQLHFTTPQQTTQWLAELAQPRRSGNNPQHE